MLKKERRKNDNSINAGSMADIAFLLLIFFLVTTTIAEDQGILVQLPRWEQEPPPATINTNNVLSVLVNGKNELLVEGEEAEVFNLRERTKNFISNPQKLKTLPSIPAKAIISLKNDRSTSYETYIGVYNELKAAYRELRDEESLRTHGKEFAQLTKDDQKIIKDKIPLVISEAEPSDIKLQ